MSVEFEEEKFVPFTRPSIEDKQSWIVSFMIKHHLAKTKESANMTLLIAATIITIANIYFFFNIQSEKKQKIYRFPNALINRLPAEMQTDVQNAIYAAKK